MANVDAARQYFQAEFRIKHDRKPRGFYEAAELAARGREEVLGLGWRHLAGKRIASGVPLFRGVETAFFRFPEVCPTSSFVVVRRNHRPQALCVAGR